MRGIAVLLFTVLLTACGAGKEFVRPDSNSLVLGTTTYDQIVATHGEPRSTASLTKNGIPLKVTSYSYAIAIPFTTKLSTKSLVFVFEDSALVSYDYASSFDDEKAAANYDDEKVKTIKTGDKKDKVLAILGRPGGESIYPIAPIKGTSVLRYTFMDTYRVPFVPTPRITRRSLTISFDASNSVTDVATSESKPD
jgi:outer membrane protein assembly factor BamE (lipoprotein component of BamABCDE complex)